MDAGQILCGALPTIERQRGREGSGKWERRCQAEDVRGGWSRSSAERGYVEKGGRDEEDENGLRLKRERLDSDCVSARRREDRCDHRECQLNSGLTSMMRASVEIDRVPCRGVLLGD